MDSNPKQSSLLKFILTVLVVFILLISVSYGFFELYLKKNWETLIKDQIKLQTGVDVNFNKFHFNFLSFLKLKPSLEITEIQVAKAIDIDKFFLEIKLKPLLQRKFILESIKIEKPKLFLVVDANNQVSLKGLDINQIIANSSHSANQAKSNPENLNAESSAQVNDPIALDSFQLDSFEIDEAQISYQTQNTKPIDINNLNLLIKDLELTNDFANSEKESSINFNTNLFGSSSSKLTYKGTLKSLPWDLHTMKSDGDLNLNVNLSDIPDDLLDKKAMLLDVSNSNQDHIKLKAKLAGDLLALMQGSGNFSLNDMMMGADKDHLLKLNSLINFNTAINMAQNPYLDFKIPKGTVAISNKDNAKTSSGNLDFSLNSRYNMENSKLCLNSKGSLEGLKIEELYHVFNPNSIAQVTGFFEIPDFNIEFAGADNASILQSMRGKGSLYFHDGRLGFLEILKKKKDKVTRFLPVDTAFLDKALESHFGEAKANFGIYNQKTHFSDIDVDTKLARLTGKGKHRFDNIVNFNFLFKVPEQLQIAFKLRGPADKPSVKIEELKLLNTKAVQSPLAVPLSRSSLNSSVNSLLKAIPTKNKKKDSTQISSDESADTINQLLDLGNQFLGQ